MSSEFNQRRATRKRATAPIPVVDAMTERVCGQLGNLSTSGVMLLVSSKPTHGGVYQVAFTLPDAQHREHRIEIGIQEQWHEPAASAGQFWSGYRIISGLDDAVRAIDEWIGPPAD
ncbi:PilZ domain-containing protein [Luteibacter yeojuensis]|uniref:PilZ domain-containing protein n=1 Tax=Luteibacter yeojuensis TaxID=345309 RepID=A0A7X5QY79_9GAMM|nr:PilZ domain-containing protein [Luteibacter yeojuensis]NID17520.1 PilZ domain-containing protein [Luteibacter yeojuensis]